MTNSFGSDRYTCDSRNVPTTCNYQRLGSAKWAVSYGSSQPTWRTKFGASHGRKHTIQMNRADQKRADGGAYLDLICEVAEVGEPGSSLPLPLRQSLTSIAKSNSLSWLPLWLPGPSPLLASAAISHRSPIGDPLPPPPLADTLVGSEERTQIKQL